MGQVTKKIAIIGGGAAGLMAVATILESKYASSYEVHLFERNNKLGAKVIISGGGRCNVTTGVRNPHKLLQHYTRGAEFLKAALSKFTPEMVYNWFEEHGTPLKMESDLRAFPVSNDGNDIVAIFEKLFTKYNVALHFKEPVKNILKTNHTFTLTTTLNTYTFDKIIITTGGNAYRKTGSKGDGYTFAQNLGHSITTLGPSLNSFLTKETWPHELSGLSFPQAQLKYKKIKVSGPFLFTHFGISGPVTFSLSSKLSFEKISEKHPIQISFIPDKSKNFENWESEFQKILTKNPKKQIKNLIQTFFPERFTQLLLLQSNIPPTKKASDISKKERQTISRLLSGDLTITLIDRRPGDEFVTAGGVSTDEINPQTMESKICPGLYFGGEVMNIDGVTGGFNLQSSWATGRLAGKNCCK